MNSNKTTLYIDESGKSSLTETSEPFILTGVILDDKELQVVEGFFTYIKRKFGIDEHTAFHSYDLYENRKTKLTDVTLEKFSKAIADFISLIPIKIQVLSVDKMVFRDAIGIRQESDLKGTSEKKEMREYPYRVMASCLFAWFTDYLVDNNFIGQILADSRRGGDHQLLKTLNLCREGHVPYKKGDLSKEISKHITSIGFAEKNFLSGGLEITDLISYTTFLRVRRFISKYENIGMKNIWNSIRSEKDFQLIELNKDDIRRFFGLKEEEVHKYLKKN